jgi:ACR3 family arsenite efflux pump ArsB
MVYPMLVNFRVAEAVTSQKHGKALALAMGLTFLVLPVMPAAGPRP